MPLMLVWNRLRRSTGPGLHGLAEGVGGDPEEGWMRLSRKAMVGSTDASPEATGRPGGRPTLTTSPAAALWLIVAEFINIDPENKRPTSQLWIALFGRWAGRVSIAVGVVL